MRGFDNTIFLLILFGKPLVIFFQIDQIAVSVYFPSIAYSVNRIVLDDFSGKTKYFGADILGKTHGADSVCETGGKGNHDTGDGNQDDVFFPMQAHDQQRDAKADGGTARFVEHCDHGQNQKAEEINGLAQHGSRLINAAQAERSCEECGKAHKSGEHFCKCITEPGA